MALRSGLLVVLALLSSGSNATTIDFDSVSVGAVVTNQFPGISISLLGAPIAGPRVYALEDTGGNPQFIFGASGNAITPGDNVGGINAPFYDMLFSFGSPVDYFSLMALDSEESVSASAYLGGSFVGSVVQGTFLGDNVATVFNGPVYRLELGSIGGSVQFDSVRIAVLPSEGPEIFDNLTYNTIAQVPEPATSFLLWAGLLALTRFRYFTRFAARHAHGATGCLSAHNPNCRSLA